MEQKSVKKASQSFVKIGMIYILSNVIIKGMAFLTTPIFTRLMSQAEYGSFSNISSWANIIAIVTTLSLHSSVSKARYDFDENIGEYMSSITIVGSAITLAAWLVLELNMGFWETLFDMSKVHIRSIMLYSLFAPAVQTLITKYRMYNEYKPVVALTWVTLLVTTVASLGLTYFMSDKLTGRVLGSYAVIAGVNALFWLYIVVKGRRVSFKMCKYAFALSLPLLVHELSGVLLNSSDRIIINQLCGETDAALYSIAYTIALILTVVMSSVNQAWVPWLFDKLEVNDTQSIQKVLPKYAGIFTLGCAALMLVGPEMVWIFGGEAYLPAVSVIPPVCFSIALQFVYTLYVNVEFYLKKTTAISLATLGATAINIALNYLLIPKFGYVVAAYTTVIGYAFMLIFHYIVCRKTVYKHLFDLKILLLNLAICLAAMITALVLYEWNIIRLCIIAALMIVVAVYVITHRRMLIEKIKSFK